MRVWAFLLLACIAAAMVIPAVSAVSVPGTQTAGDPAFCILDLCSHGSPFTVEVSSGAFIPQDFFVALHGHSFVPWIPDPAISYRGPDHPTFSPPPLS